MARASDVSQHLERLMSLAHDLVLVVRADGTIEHFSPSWTQVLGWTEDELRGRPAFDFIHPDDREASMENAQRLIADGAVETGFTNRYMCKDGSVRHLEWNAAVSEDRERFYCIARDVTERMQQRAALQRRAEDLEAFAFTLAHDIRSPLRAVGVTVGLLRRGELSPESADAAFAAVAHRIKTIDEMVSGLLTLASLEDRPRLDEPVDMQAIAADILRQLREEGRPTDAIEVDTLPPCRGDPRLLRQALNNIIVNAMQHAVHDPSIHVTGHISGGEVTYTVLDNGPGFALRDAERIWAPLEGERLGGTGLGLAIVKRITEAHGGHVACMARQGSGAAFSFTIPA